MTPYVKKNIHAGRTKHVGVPLTANNVHITSSAAQKVEICVGRNYTVLMTKHCQGKETEAMVGTSQCVKPTFHPSNSVNTLAQSV
jgi:hypothetical protein